VRARDSGGGGLKNRLPSCRLGSLNSGAVTLVAEARNNM
jgi:hypothetical protein